MQLPTELKFSWHCFQMTAISDCQYLDSALKGKVCGAQGDQIARSLRDNLAAAETSVWVD
jgi:hypothetical protein